MNSNNTLEFSTYLDSAIRQSHITQQAILQVLDAGSKADMTESVFRECYASAQHALEVSENLVSAKDSFGKHVDATRELNDFMKNYTQAKEETE